MIELTKINGETILINPIQIEYVELIPESKVIMMNGKFHIVIEDKRELTRRVVEFWHASHKGTEWEA